MLHGDTMNDEEPIKHIDVELIHIRSRQDIGSYTSTLGLEVGLYRAIDTGVIWLHKSITDERCEIGSDGRNLFPGDRLFQLRATHGLPIGDAIHRIYSATTGVDWVSFIEEARRNGWYDFQTIEAIENAFLDCDFDKAFALNVIKRMKHWMLTNPLK